MSKFNKDQVLEGIVNLTNMRYMKVIQTGFVSVAALTICGSLFNLLKSIPIPFYQTWLAASGLGDVLSIPIAICSNMMALFVVLGMGYTMGQSFEENPLSSALVSLASFLILTPLQTVATIVTESGEKVSGLVTNVIPTSALGSPGIFLAMFVGIAFSRIYIAFLKAGIKIKMPETVPSMVTGMFESMIPGGITFVVAVVLRQVMALTPFGTCQTFIYTMLQKPLMAVGGGFFGAFVFCLTIKILWFFGIHGGLVCNAVFAPIMSAAAAENLAAFAAGTPAPNLAWGFVATMNNFAWISVSLAMIFSCKSAQFKSLGKISLPTSCFAISEPLVFGAPIVLNPILAVPFIVTAPLNFVMTYVVMKIGIVAPITGASITTWMPGPLVLCLQNAHWTGLVWGIAMLVLDYFIWLPFLKFADKQACKLEQEAVEA